MTNCPNSWSEKRRHADHVAALDLSSPSDFQETLLELVLALFRVSAQPTPRWPGVAIHRLRRKATPMPNTNQVAAMVSSFFMRSSASP